MKIKDLAVGMRVAVGREDYNRQGEIVEIGTYVKDVYHGRSFRGTPTTFKGVRVLPVDRDGNVRTEKVVSKRTPDTTVVHVGDNGEQWTEVIEGEIVAATVPEPGEWIRPQEVLRPWQAQQVIIEARQDAERQRTLLASRVNAAAPRIIATLEAAGVPSYRVSKYATGGEVKMSFAEFDRLVASLKGEAS